MPLSSQEIASIAHLARLELGAEESENLRLQLNDFFNVVDQMQAMNTNGVEPLAHPLAAIQEVALRLREDVVSEPNLREANQRSAPVVEQGLFLVPKVID